MPTYFGYVEREADSYINWAEIGKGISDTVNEIDKVRNEKKAALDQVSRDFQAKLSEYPTGQDINANGFAYRYSDNASQFMLMQQRLLKQGKLKLKDYLNNTQNIMDDTENAFTLVKTYQEQYGKKMEQYRNKEISLAEVKNFAYLEGFGGFTDTDLYINPLDGSISLGKTKVEKVDGKEVRTMAEGQQNLMSVGAMKQLMNTPIPRYDMEKETLAMAKGMGKNVQLMIDNGVITSFEGIRKRMYGKDILKSDNPDDITNVLLDNNFDFGGLSITTIDKVTDPKTGKTTDVKTTKSFADREFDLADKYLEVKNKPDSLLTDEEKKLKFSVERSLKGSEQDQKMMFEYQKAENEIIKANLGTSYNYMSALIDNNVTDKNGNPYDITWDADEAKKNPNMILAKLENGTVNYDLTTKQKEAAENTIRDQIRAKLDEEMKYIGSYKTPEEKRTEAEVNKVKAQAELNKSKQGRAPTKAEIQEGKTRQQYNIEGHLLEQLYYSDKSEKIEEAKQYYKNLNPWIKDIYRTQTGVIVEYKTEDGQETSQKLPFFDERNNPLGIERFVKSVGPFFYGNKIGQNLNYLIEGIRNKNQLEPETTYIDRGKTMIPAPGWNKPSGPLKSNAGKGGASRFNK
jgi:hypothetical protein